MVDHSGGADFVLNETELGVVIIIVFCFFDFDCLGTLVAFSPPEWWRVLPVCVNLVLRF